LISNIFRRGSKDNVEVIGSLGFHLFKVVWFNRWTKRLVVAISPAYITCSILIKLHKPVML